MRSTITALALAAAFLAALTLYAVSHDTRRLEAKVHGLERSFERAEADVAALRAEYAHLSRPERIEPLARAMGLGAPSPRQIVTLDRIGRREPPKP